MLVGIQTNKQKYNALNKSAATTHAAVLLV